MLAGEQPLSRGSLEAVDGFYRTLVTDVLGLLPPAEEGPGAGMATQLIDLLVETRTKLRQNKQWALADEVRNRLTEMGVQLKDSAEGTTWTLE